MLCALHSIGDNMKCELLTQLPIPKNIQPTGDKTFDFFMRFNPQDIVVCYAFFKQCPKDENKCKIDAVCWGLTL